MIEFWGHPLSFNARKVHWMLEELGVPYEHHVVDLVAGEHTQPAFREITPLRRVPVLVDDGLRLLESNAIAWYLGERYGTTASALTDRANIHMWMLLEANHLRPALQAPWRMTWISPLIGEPHDRAQLPGLVEAAHAWLASAEELLAGRPYLVNNELSVADVCLAPVIECAPQLGIALPAGLAAWYARIRERPAFAKTAPPSLGW